MTVSKKQAWVDRTTREVKERIARHYQDIEVLANEIGDAALVESIQDLIQRLEDPFMFVIVGEVKAGKSSFINALLESEEEICPVSPAPKTDTIQQILYGDSPREVIINPYLKRIHLPIPVLRDIAIVDTPGTNTIINHHQEITERFIPAADVVIFVFEAKNPYRQSAWEFFNYIHDSWKRKIIFILQQKDLLSASDLQVNYQGLLSHAKSKGLPNPNIFSVSAKLEIEGDKENSGFTEVREYLSEHITGQKASVEKLSNLLSTARQLSGRIEKAIGLREDQLNADILFRNDIKETLETDSALAGKQVDNIVDAITGRFAEVTKEIEQELSSGLGIINVLGRSFKSIFTKGQSISSWLERLNTDLQQLLENSLREQLNQGIFDLSERIQQMSRMVDMKIQATHTILKPDAGIFKEIANSRIQLMDELKDTFKEFLHKPESFSDESIERSGSKLTPQVATGTGMAIVGAILTAITQGVVFDVTGGVLTAVGILFASISVGWQRRKIIQKYREEVNAGKAKMSRELRQALMSYIEKIKARIESNFVDFDTHLENESTEIKRLKTSLNTTIHNLEMETKMVKKL